MNSNFYTYHSCRNIVLSNKIKTRRQYREYRKDSCDKRLPFSPNSVYKDWVSWNEFLEKKERKVLSYIEAVRYNKDNNIKSMNQYIEHINSNNIDYLLKYPENYKEWNGWDNYFSRSGFIKYDDAVSHLSKFKFSSIEDYKKWISDNKIDFIPKVPNKYYKKEWKGWEKYFNKSDRFIGYDQAIDFIKKIGIRTQREYKFWQKYNKINFLPNWPDGVYKEWQNWSIFLSNDQNQSSGESIIEKFLQKNDITYVSQKRFKDCRNNKPLPFDFYLSDKNICIEFDGIQHYEVIEYFGGINRYVNQKKNDSIKDIYCQEKNIKLIRIPYWDIKKIDNILYGII